MLNFSQILEGWRNNIIPPAHLKDLIENTAKERIAICEQCPHHSSKHKTMRPDAHCVECGCTLAAKTKCLSCSCPFNKWVALVTQEEEENIKKQTAHE